MCEKGKKRLERKTSQGPQTTHKHHGPLSLVHGTAGGASCLEQMANLDNKQAAQSDSFSLENRLLQLATGTAIVTHVNNALFQTTVTAASVCRVCNTAWQSDYHWLLQVSSAVSARETLARSGKLQQTLQRLAEDAGRRNAGFFLLPEGLLLSPPSRLQTEGKDYVTCMQFAAPASGHCISTLPALSV